MHVEPFAGRTGGKSWAAVLYDFSMGDVMVRRESAVEYFKELVEGALAHQGIAASELTAFYVVQLLAGFLQRRSPGIDTDESQPMALRLAQALESGGLEHRLSVTQI